MARQNIVAINRAIGGVIEVSPELAFNWLTTGEGVLIDVREQDELEIEWIPGATAMPLSKFNSVTIAGMATKKIILICHTGRRSREAAESLLGYDFFEVYSVKDGLLAWNAAGLESLDQSALLI